MGNEEKGRPWLELDGGGGGLERPENGESELCG